MTDTPSTTWPLHNCTSVTFEHPGYVHITLVGGDVLVAGSLGLDFFLAPKDMGDTPTNTLDYDQETPAFARPVARVSSEHTGGNVWIDLIELEGGAALTVGTDVAIAWRSVEDARRMIASGDETLLDAALACIWLFEA